ncbi:H-NS histone family protein [Yoonia sp.]|uniref:H-NS histone family protein n=1 Tax=Yoonia sp. TaxID=2212373 RepID=UPI002FD8B0CC
MNTDLKSMTRKELLRLQANVEKALARLEKQEKQAALVAAEKAAAAHGFTLAEITGASIEKTPRKSATLQKQSGVPKYKNPDDPAKTWTGKGRQPDWFKSAIAAGKNPKDLEI